MASSSRHFFIWFLLIWIINGFPGNLLMRTFFVQLEAWSLKLGPYWLKPWTLSHGLFYLDLGPWTFTWTLDFSLGPWTFYLDLGLSTWTLNFLLGPWTLNFLLEPGTFYLDHVTFSLDLGLFSWTFNSLLRPWILDFFTQVFVARNLDLGLLLWT